MAIRSSKVQFGAISKGFHWIIAALFVVMFAIGWYMDWLPLGLEKLGWLSRHKSIGMTILFLAILRIVWRLGEPTPEALGKHLHERLAAKVGHLALYVVMIIMPLSGWMMSSAANYPVSFFGLFTMPNLVGPDKELFETLKVVHLWLSWGIVVLVAGHAAAALKHHFIDRDATMIRMLPGSRNKGNL